MNFVLGEYGQWLLFHIFFLYNHGISVPQVWNLGGLRFSFVYQNFLNFFNATDLLRWQPQWKIVFSAAYPAFFYCVWARLTPHLQNLTLLSGSHSQAHDLEICLLQQLSLFIDFWWLNFYVMFRKFRFTKNVTFHHLHFMWNKQYNSLKWMSEIAYHWSTFYMRQNMNDTYSLIGC